MSKTYKLSKSLPIMLIEHFARYAFYYITALLSLYLLHYFQMLLPELAKNLAQMTGQTNAVKDTPILEFVLLAIAIIVFRTASRLLFFLPARLQQRDLRIELIELLENAHPSLYHKFNDGQIYQVSFNDINRIRGFVGFGLLQVGNIIIATYVIIPKVLAFNSELMYAFIPMIVGVVIFSIISLLSEPYSKKTSKAQGEVQNFIIESYNAKSTIKNFHSEKSFINRFIELSSFEMKNFFYASMGPTVSIPLTRLSFGASLLWGAYIIYQNNLGAPALIYFSGVIFLASEPLAFLSWIGVVFISGYAGWKRVKELANELMLDKKFTDEPYANSSTIDFWGQKINFPLQTKKWTAMVGQTGCGKSYALKSIADDLDFHRQSYSMVMQEPYLYNDTVADNIFLGKTPDQSEYNTCLELLKLFGLDVLADTTENVLKLEVGENGKKVSGGQAKRICLLRSVFAKVDWILWDDPFSSVDLILESQIIQKLKSLESMKNKTIVLTSHRLSTVKNCEQILFLEKNNGIPQMGGLEILTAKGATSEYFSKQLV